MRTVLLCLCLAGSLSLANASDLNADHKVSLQDFYLFNDAWKSQAGSPNYNDLCDLSVPKDQLIDIRDLVVFADNWLWQAIRLDIYSDGWGYFANTVWLEEEGSWTFKFEDSLAENYLGYQGLYYAYVSRPGNFTELVTFKAIEVTRPFPPTAKPTFQATLDVDLDPIEPNLFNGTIFLTQPFFTANYLAYTEGNVLDWDTHQPVTLFTTDAQGRFSTELDEGTYLFTFYEGSDQHTEDAFVYGSYLDFCYPSFIILFKPNIYLYPQSAADLTVTVDFPAGGSVIASEPHYADSWQITADPTGRIDGLYDYLFYESSQPDYGQYQAGWVVAKDNLEDFFRTNLAQTGFIQNEIDDFIEYWLPRLKTSPWYAIYPQYNAQLDKMVRLSFSQQPDNLIRLIYAVRGIPTGSLTLPAPEIPAFSRDGFTAAEWGVTLK